MSSCGDNIWRQDKRANYINSSDANPALDFSQLDKQALPACKRHHNFIEKYLVDSV